LHLDTKAETLSESTERDATTVATERKRIEGQAGPVIHSRPKYEMMTDIDFSHVNLAYLIQARDLARRNPTAGALLLDIPEQLACRLANMTPASLAQVTEFKPPLVSPRLHAWWWERLLRALTDGEPGELQVILEHAGLLVGNQRASETGN